MTRQQMACPARRELQRQVMKRTRGKMEQARRQATYTQEWRERQAIVLRGLRDDAEVEKKRKAEALKTLKKRLAKIRGGDIPEGYETLYYKLRKTHKIPASESLRIVRAQRGADLRSS